MIADLPLTFPDGLKISTNIRLLIRRKPSKMTEIKKSMSITLLGNHEGMIL
jgi:hypothetical protein